MLSDQAMTKYIKLDERQGPKAFNIPNIEAFVANALPKYFPDMNQVFRPRVLATGNFILHYPLVGKLSKATEQLRIQEKRSSE